MTPIRRGASRVLLAATALVTVTVLAVPAAAHAGAQFDETGAPHNLGPENLQKKHLG